MPVKVFGELQSIKYIFQMIVTIVIAVIHSFCVGKMFQDFQWRPEAVDGSKPYIYYGSSCTHAPRIKFNL